MGMVLDSFVVIGSWHSRGICTSFDISDACYSIT